MSEELLQRDLLNNPEKIGNWNFYNIGSITIKQLKENGIIENKEYKGLENKKPDALITTSNKKVIAIIEHKKPSSFKTKKQKDLAIQQELKIAQKLTKLLIVTDTVETIWINATNGQVIIDEKNQPLVKNFDKNDESIIKLINHINNSIDSKNSKLKEIKNVDPTDLAKSIWQDVWSVSGATPENCLYTFVELFIFKYLSDLNVLKAKYSFDRLIEQYEEDSDEEVLEDYAKIIRKKIKELFKINPKDNTTIINGTIFVSKDEKAVQGYATVFKKILFKFKEYGKLENIDYDFKSKLFESFLKESISKKNWGQFFTPLKVVQAIAKLTEIKPNMKICDPACGVGKFILEPILKNLNTFYSVKKGKLTSNIKLFGFDKGFDKDEQKTIILAKANMLIYFSSLIKENPEIADQFSNLFNDTFELKTNSILGTLAEPKNEEYDLILTNPPYVTSGSSNLKDEIKKRTDLEQYYKINAIGVEGLFMEWIVRSLKKGGTAFIVVPDGILNRINDKNLRKFILDSCNIDLLISLPIGTFFTTPKKTYILGVTKKYDLNEIQETPIFTYLVSDIGETLDVRRFETENNQLDEAVNLFNQFKGAKNHFKTNDERCKVIPISRFKSDYTKHWIIDRWWSEKEKIKLGIKEEIKKIHVRDYSDLILESSDSLKEASESIKELTENKYKFKKVKIKEIFDLSQKTNNSKFTKTFIEKHKGKIPVYSASKDENAVDYGFIKENLDTVKYFEDCLTWNIDGSIGKVFFRKGRFSLSEKVIPLVILPELKNQLFEIYLKYEIEKEFSTKDFNFGNKAGKSKIQDIEINIPINKKGDFDIENQKEIAEKYLQIDDIKNEIQKSLNKIINLNVDMD